MCQRFLQHPVHSRQTAMFHHQERAHHTALAQSQAAVLKNKTHTTTALLRSEITFKELKHADDGPFDS